MQEHIWVKPINNSDLNIYQYGHENCSPQHSFGPAVRDHYLLHFITCGKGVFTQANKTYELCENQGFLICPDNITYYEADSILPWTYYWVGFNGDHVSRLLYHCGISEEHPIFGFRDFSDVQSLFETMKLADEKTKMGQLKLTGLFYLLLSVIEGKDHNAKLNAGNVYGTKKEYVQSAIVFIQKNYARKISVAEISDYIGLNRSYFGAVFKENTKMTPQEFMLRFRMQKATELLKNRILAIGDVSRSVGYEDPLLFSKMYKKVHGISPSEFRKTHYL